MRRAQVREDVWRRRDAEGPESRPAVVPLGRRVVSAARGARRVPRARRVGAVARRRPAGARRRGARPRTGRRVELPTEVRGRCRSEGSL